MKHLVATLLVLAALALAGGASAARIGNVGPGTIDDKFTGKSFDTNVWAWWGSNQPGQVSFTQGGGAMTVTVAAGAQPDFNLSGQTRCAASGDFDARVDFDLNTWPSQNGVWVSLMAAGTPYNTYRVSWQFDPSEQYGAYLPPVGNNLPATGTSGSLRLRRWGDIFTSYYLSGRRWVPLVSGIGPTGDLPFSLGVFNISNAATLSGQPVSVAWDNFRVTADRIVCP